MWIKSHWKITWDSAGTPLVLVAYNDWIPGELEIPVAQEVQRESLVGANWQATIPRGNLSRQLLVSRLEAYSTSHELRAAVLTTAIAADALVGLKKSITVAVLKPSDGTDHLTKTFANCSLVSHKVTVAPSGTRLLREWEFAAGALT